MENEKEIDIPDVFRKEIHILFKSKGKYIDGDIVIVWYGLLINTKKYNVEIISFAFNKLIFSDVKTFDVNDIVKIIEPKADPQVIASDHLRKIEELDNLDGFHQIANDTFFTLFSGISDYRDLPGDKKRWARREFIDLYIKNVTEKKRLLQIDQVKKHIQIDNKL